jgi:hypothetical protein
VSYAASMIVAAWRKAASTSPSSRTIRPLQRAAVASRRRIFSVPSAAFLPSFQSTSTVARQRSHGYHAWDAPTRWFHWINAILVVALLVFGVAMVTGR